MKKDKYLSKVLIIVTIIFSICFYAFPAYSHSGRTDSNGGHKDKNNVSGLGPDHYHCGGNPPHLHNGGVCPYSSSAGVAQSSSSETSTTQRKTTTTATKSVVEEKPAEIYAQSIKINLKDLEILIGDSKKISATIYPENTTNKTITWTSSDENICKIDSEGNIFANNVGEATITAKTSNNKQASMKVTVKPIKVTQIEINIEKQELNPGETLPILATVYPENATDKTINWVVENPDILTIEEGKIVAKEPGTTKLFCSSNDGINSETTITVNKQDAVENTAVTNENLDNINNSGNSSDVDNTKYTITNMGLIITLIEIIDLVILAINLDNKNEKLTIKNIVLNAISWILFLFALCFLLVANSIVSAIFATITPMLIAPPICKLINLKLKNKYTVTLRFVLYAIFIVVTIMSI